MTSKRVPIVPTEAQWSGFARRIMMAWDLGCDTPRKMFEYFKMANVQVPQWMQAELEMQNLDHAPSKGTRATLIYRAMIEDAPDASESTEPLAMLVIQPDGHETLMKYTKVSAKAFDDMKCKVVLLSETEDDQVSCPKDETVGFDDFFDKRIDILAEKHPALLVRQLAQLVRKQRDKMDKEV